ncbi:NitT/TauT family transport system ATP-binding protein [Arthrobacter globiformis]|uniref:ABC transporter ATP-binding protein n=1 Tax=Arthrobacter globiformis TaxID=1665 RepID=UPI00278043EC|nr:ABC transporter ATP-binding protein [Arthrobacter globiformis]MDQ1060828.1 NitT/TauT family transport system ATP-binding protein [Arthrobacter globiformis]
MTDTTIKRSLTGARALSAQGLAKTYGTGATARTVLGDISFDVYDRETVCIVGPSGAGKTTLLRCLAGLMPSTAGTVFIGEDKVVGPPPRMAVVFQDYSRSLMPWLTVQANVELPLRGRPGISATQRRERARAALASVGLENSGSQHPWQLSGGMQQRVAIARAVAYEPAVLLMDEPFASVDAQTRSDLEDLTHTIKEKYGMTILLVTHDIEESVYLADRVIVLSGTPTSVSEIVPVNLPHPRDQVATKSTREFADLRAHILGLVRRQQP